ncbi:hypothetical protein KFZ58_15815 [Virgibacillus sp. NKC19-16]|uniref:hypothetical protein n=1 Tax=Virgibacillus salidurans TaxID=2831673 RepID=UPI001F3D44E3|nr:hypothetical protein [Virgibacillus sp. NKC19-16]UJL45830.1 hypothetical protein KFZ58_15815 [Virgibacillus sp. NKC19-16]
MTSLDEAGELEIKMAQLLAQNHKEEDHSATQDQYFAYLARLKWILDEAAFPREMELRVQEAEEKAAKAAAEAQQKTKERIARELLLKGSNVEFVAETTGIDTNHVIKIQQDMYR